MIYTLIIVALLIFLRTRTAGIIRLLIDIATVALLIFGVIVPIFS